jgi:AraC-like DNA-binding protein
MEAPNLIDRYARAMIAGAVDRGFDLAEISRFTGIEMDAISGNDLAVIPNVIGMLSHAIKLMMNDEFCGFTANRCRLGSFYPFTFEAMIREDTLGEALERAFTFYSLVTDDIKFELTEHMDVATITVTLAQPNLDRFHYLQEWWLLSWSHTSAWLIGEEIPISEIHFPHGPHASREEYKDAFWGRCDFFQPTGCFQFPARFLRRRVARSRGEIPTILANQSIDLVSVQGVHRSWKALVKSKMKEWLFKTESLLSIEALAFEFNVSSQTLRRRLEEDGISFRSLKEEVRREVILAWLAEPNIPIGEISLRAGFAERNGLARVVRSWVGVSPSEYRHRVTKSISAAKPHTLNFKNAISGKLQNQQEIYARL